MQRMPSKLAQLVVRGHLNGESETFMRLNFVSDHIGLADESRRARNGHGLQ